MPLPSSGAISFTMLKNEFLHSGTTIKLSDYYGANNAAPTSGAINVNVFHGKTTSNTDLYNVTGATDVVHDLKSGMISVSSWAFNSESSAGAKDGYDEAQVGAGNGDKDNTDWIVNAYGNNPGGTGLGRALLPGALIARLTVQIKGFAWLSDETSTTGAGTCTARGNVQIYAVATKSSDPASSTVGTLVGEIQFTTGDVSRQTFSGSWSHNRPSVTYQAISTTLDVSSLNLVGSNVNTLKVSYYAQMNTMTLIGDHASGSGTQLYINILEGAGTANGPGGADAGLCVTAKGRYQ